MRRLSLPASFALTKRLGSSLRLVTLTTQTTSLSLFWPKRKWDFPSSTVQSSRLTSNSSRWVKRVAPISAIRLARPSLLSMKETSMALIMWRLADLPKACTSCGSRKRESACLSRCIKEIFGINHMNSSWRKDLWLKGLARESTALESMKSRSTM